MNSNAQGHPDRGTAVFAVTTVTLALASVFVAARMICRIWIVNRVTLDDYVMCLAWLFALFLSFSIDLGVANGLGQHDDDIAIASRPVLRRCEYVFSILYNPALMATKTSILIFYLRLAKNAQAVLKYASWALLAIVNTAGIVLTFMNIFQCNPISGAWNPDLNHPPKCFPLLTVLICAAPVNIITDLAILALPIPVLTSMRLPARQKNILVLTFTIGVFVSIVDVIRIYYLQYAITEVPNHISQSPQSSFGGSPDFAWRAARSLMWSAVEVNVGITCACVPTLKPLLLKLIPSMLYESSGPQNRSNKTPTPSDTPLQGTKMASPQGSLADIGRPDPAAANTGTLGSEHFDSTDAQMSALEFLTVPEGMGGSMSRDTTSGLPVTPTATLSSQSHTETMATGTGQAENAVYFGFVNLKKPKSMLKSSTSESFKYCTVVTILFLLWGISYGLLTTLNNVVANVNDMSTARTMGLGSAYWGGGYLFGPLLVGEWILRRDEHPRSRRHLDLPSETIGGFKATFIIGLCIYGTGTIIFWPSAVTNSYGGFIVSNLVVGFGLSVLEVGANAFLILCGPPEYGEVRLLVAQGVQGVGTVLSGVLADKVFFKSIASSGVTSNNDSMTLINVQWTYLGITLLCVILALFFYYMPLPELSDDELDASAKRLPVNPKTKTIFGLQLRTLTLGLAVFAQFWYTASQEGTSNFFSALLRSIIPGQAHSGPAATSNEASSNDKTLGMALSTTDYLLIAHTAFALSRFLVALLVFLSISRPRWPRPRTYLIACITLCFVFALLPVVSHPNQADLLVIPVILFFFAEGPIWPLIFAIGLRGQGRRTKRAAAFITMGGSGAAIVPFIMYGIVDNGGTVQTAFIVIIALQAVMLLYPSMLHSVKNARLLADPNLTVTAPHRSRCNVQESKERLEPSTRHNEVGGEKIPDKSMRKVSRTLLKGGKGKSALQSQPHGQVRDEG